MSEADPTSLKIEEITFNPENETGYGKKDVVIDGQEVTVHDTNNLFEYFKSYIHVIDGKDPYDSGVYAIVLSKESSLSRKIFDEFAKVYPGTFQRIRAVTRDQRQAREKAQSGPPERDMLRAALAMTDELEDIIQPRAEDRGPFEKLFSDAFDGLVPIGQKQRFDIQQLC